MQRAWALYAISVIACSGEITGSAGDGGTTTSDGRPADVPGGVGEPAELMGITLFHNQVRAMVQTATPLPALQWDPSLAATAASWVAMCQNTDSIPQIMDHSSVEFRSAGQPYYVGENIFASGGAATAQQAVEVWASEGSGYDYASNTCSGPTCGHYTQIVWRATIKLGCAKGNCPNIQFPNTILCNYGPGGNSGGKPY